VVLKEIKMKSLMTHSFADTRMERDLYIVYHKDKYLSSPVRAFIQQAMVALK